LAGFDSATGAPSTTGVLVFLENRTAHYGFLIILGLALFFYRLGEPSLWDIDEGNNAEAAREMLVSGDWIVPTFNYALRTDKPALLYWLQNVSYRLVGTNELGARLPAATAALLVLLVTYEIGRRLYNSRTGLLAAMILASTVNFCGAARFANPDTLLVLCTTGALFAFWCGQGWQTPWSYVPMGACLGFAILAKGPVGVLLPLSVIGVFLLLGRDWRLILDVRWLPAAVACLGVAAPWYVLVGTQTKFQFLKSFWLTHNVGRFQTTMEGHYGPPYYYLVCLLIGFAPWCIFLGGVCWRALRSINEHRQAGRFLWCWIAVYFLFFSVSATKLPNYILPLYPAVALVTARELERWRSGDLVWPVWHTRISLAGLIIVALVTGAGLLILGGVVPGMVDPAIAVPGLGRGIWFALVPLAAVIGLHYTHQKQRTATLAILAAAAILFIGSLATWASAVVDRQKAAKQLAQACIQDSGNQEIRLGCLRCFEPSMVFYARREVAVYNTDAEALDLLRYPIPVYLFVRDSDWKLLRPRASPEVRTIARHWDLYQKCDVLVVTNSNKTPPGNAEVVRTDRGKASAQEVTQPSDP
jgi:4-amino-4-deoxy-L-arabinose transferase-like glycosyltransferase